MKRGTTIVISPGDEVMRAACDLSEEVSVRLEAFTDGVMSKEQRARFAGAVKKAAEALRDGRAQPPSELTTD
jgi:hypothetical protein